MPGLALSIGTSQSGEWGHALGIARSRNGEAPGQVFIRRTRPLRQGQRVYRVTTWLPNAAGGETTYEAAFRDGAFAYHWYDVLAPWFEGRGEVTLAPIAPPDPVDLFDLDDAA